MTREEVEKLLELEAPDCGDSSCRFRDTTKPSGMRTNGGCRCSENRSLSPASRHLLTIMPLIRPLCLDWLRLKEENEKMLSLFARVEDPKFVAELEKDLEK